MVTISMSASSFLRNADLDWVNLEGAVQLIDAIGAPLGGNLLTEPLQATVKDWDGAPVKSILSLSGGYEVFLDDIRAFGKVLERAGLNVQNIECPEQGHIECILDAQTRLPPRSMTRAIWDWLGVTL
jgi:acetyl esterase/lipase